MGFPGIKIFVAEVVSGRDSDKLETFRAEVIRLGAEITNNRDLASGFILPWTSYTAVASHVLSWAMEVERRSKVSGTPRLYWLPVDGPLSVPAGYSEFESAAMHLPDNQKLAATAMMEDMETGAHP